MSAAASGRRRSLPSMALLIAAAGSGAVADAFATGGEVDRWISWAFLAGTLPWALPLRRAPRGPARPRARRSRRALLGTGAAVAVLASLLLGNGAAAPLALLLPAILRGPGRATPERRLRTVREGLFAAGAVLLLRGTEGALAGMIATTLLAALVLPGIAAARRPAGRGAGAPRLQGAALAAAVAVVAPVLFVLLPRFSPAAGPEPSPLAPPPAARRTPPPGIGGERTLTGVPMHEVHIGDIGRLQTDLRPLLEVLFLRDGRPAAPGTLGPLLRSSALERFDGLSWSSPAGRGFVLEDRQDGIADGWVTLPRRDLPYPPAGERWEQELHFLAGGTDSLFALGVPEAVGGEGSEEGILVLPRGEVRAAAEYRDGTRFRVRSVVARGAYPEVDGEVPDRERASRLLAIPAGHDRAVALARSELAGAGRGRAMLRRLETLLRTRCTYSLEIPSDPRSTPVETFLFESRRGHCELYASSAAVLLRAVGVPARVVVGFRGGEADAATLRHTFRGADAHAWVEARLAGIGWVTFDPTPGSGPEEAPEGEPGSAGGAGSAPDLLGGVLEFDAAAQRRVLLGAARATGRALRLLLLDGSGRPDLLVILALATAAAGLRFLLRSRAAPGRRTAGGAPPRPPPPPPPEAWALLESRLADGGLRRGTAETVREFAVRAVASGAAPAASVLRVAAAGERERWGRLAPDPGERAALLALVAAVSPPAPAAPRRQ